LALVVANTLKPLASPCSAAMSNVEAFVGASTMLIASDGRCGFLLISSSLLHVLNKIALSRQNSMGRVFIGFTYLIIYYYSTTHRTGAA
jgi:hypothetical protein